MLFLSKEKEKEILGYVVETDRQTANKSKVAMKGKRVESEH
jgi:hypothetical protein